MPRIPKSVALIIGCQRSGTYLLCTMIDSQLPIAAPVEPQFIPLFRRLLPLWGDLSTPENRRRLLSAIYDFLEIWTPRSERGRDLTKVRAQSLLITRESADAIVAESSDYDGLVAAIFSEFARLNGKQSALDKSAFLSYVAPERLSPRPDKVIHIVRDGRDVVLSWIKGWWGPQTISEATRFWKRHVQEGRRWGAAHPGQYLEVRYEDLITDPDAVLGRVARFFGVPYGGFDADAHKKSTMVDTLSKGQDHALISKGIDASNKDKWRTEMRPSDLRLFEFMAGDALAECGYPLGSPAPFTCGERLLFAARIAGSAVHRKFSVRYWKWLIKESLPLVLFACQVLRIPIARLSAPPGWLPR